MDAAGNASACSTSSITYAESTVPTAVGAPTLSGPTGPANGTTPTILGSAAPAATTVRLFLTADCSGTPLASGPVTSGSFAVQVTVAANASTVIRASVTDGGGNTSPCSAPLTYVEDSTPPVVTITSSTPPSPSKNRSPTFHGTASEPGLVRLTTYVPFCGIGTNLSLFASSFDLMGLAGLPLMGPLPANASSLVMVVETDAAGNRSCSAPFTYTHDAIAPAPPTLGSTVPASPANANAPRVVGSAEAGSVVLLYATADCSGTPLATGSAAALASPGLPIAVADNSTTTVRGTATDAAGNASPCSPPIVFVEDSTPPAAPFLTGTTPAGPANMNSPLVLGAAEAGSTILLYGGSSCSGSPIGKGVAATLTSPGIPVSVPDNVTLSIRATAVDAAGNVSACSAPRSYVEDSTPPAVSAAPDIGVESKLTPVVVTFATPSARDSLDGLVSATCSPKSGSGFPFGKTLVRCTATDRAGNSGSTTFAIVVQLPTTPGAVNDLRGTPITRVSPHQPVLVTAGGFAPGSDVVLTWVAGDGSVRELRRVRSVATVVSKHACPCPARRHSARGR